MHTHTKPAIGRIVRFRGRFGQHAMRAAIIACTVDTLEQAGVDEGTIPPLTDQDHVHLHVITPSTLGFFTEYDVPQASGDEVAPGEWDWMPHAA